MKSYSKSLFTLLCLTFVFLTVGASISTAQTSNKPNTKQLWELVREKRQNTPFVLLSPEDLSKISTDGMAELTNAGDPCETAAPIDIGQTIFGSLTNSDCQLDDGSYADFYIFNGTQGQQSPAYNVFVEC